MAKLAVTNTVIQRDAFGRFISECDAAATDTIRRTVEYGERMAKGAAPKGKKPDPRTQKLVNSIEGHMLSAREGVVTASARHALAQEFGAVPHRIEGDPLRFFWEREGRFFTGPRVNHPGNPPHPYLRPAFRAMMRRVMAIAKEEYP